MRPLIAAAPWTPVRSLTPLVLVAALLAGCQKPGAPGPGRAASASAAAPLLLAPEDLLTVEATRQATGPVITGALQPERRADLRAEVGAVVLQVLRENGESVRSGDLLVRLDDAAIRDSLVSAQEAVRASSQSFEQAERQLQRLRTLQGQGMTSMQALEDAEVRRNNAQSDLVAARARLATAQQQLRRTEVRAPFAGVVSERRVSAGDTAQVGKELVKVIDPSSLRFEGLVSADRMNELRLGQRVGFRVNGAPDQEFVGTVQRIDAAANAATRQVEVVVGFADRRAAPRVAGLFAEGRIETGGAEVLMLPEPSLLRAGDNAQVWKLDGASLRKVALTLGERDARSGLITVRSGLAVGDRVLRHPVGQLRDGQAVELARRTAEPSSASSVASAGAAAAASAAASAGR